MVLLRVDFTSTVVTVYHIFLRARRNQYSYCTFKFKITQHRLKLYQKEEKKQKEEEDTSSSSCFFHIYTYTIVDVGCG